MSETVTSAVPSAAIVAQQSNDSLLSPQFILAGFTMAIVAGTVSAVLMHGDDGNIKLVLGFVFGMGSGVGAFCFGSSKSSQAKDATIAATTAPLVGTTTTTTAPSTVVVTPTGNNP